MELSALLALPSKHWDVYHFAGRDLKWSGCFWQPANLPQAAGIHSVRIIFWNNSTRAVIGWILIHTCLFFLPFSPVFFILPYYIWKLRKNSMNWGDHFIFILGEGGGGEEIRKDWLISRWIMSSRENVTDWRIHIKTEDDRVRWNEPRDE